MRLPHSRCHHYRTLRAMRQDPCHQMGHRSPVAPSLHLLLRETPYPFPSVTVPMVQDLRLLHPCLCLSCPPMAICHPMHLTSFLPASRPCPCPYPCKRSRRQESTKDVKTFVFRPSYTREDNASGGEESNVGVRGGANGQRKTDSGHVTIREARTRQEAEER